MMLAMLLCFGVGSKEILPCAAFSLWRSPPLFPCAYSPARTHTTPLRSPTSDSLGRVTPGTRIAFGHCPCKEELPVTCFAAGCEK